MVVGSLHAWFPPTLMLAAVAKGKYSGMQRITPMKGAKSNTSLFSKMLHEVNCS